MSDPKDPDHVPAFGDVDASIQTLAQIHTFLLAHLPNEASAGVVLMPKYELFDNISQAFVSELDVASD